MRIRLRPASLEDAEEGGRICYEAFSSVAGAHGFPIDWRSPEAARTVIEARLTHAQTYGVAAEVEGRIAGIAFLKEYRPIGAIGPVTVTPHLQGGSLGRMMMEHLLARADGKGLLGTRLVQAAYNVQSLALYTKLGFDARAPLACVHGEALARGDPRTPVRSGTEADLAQCNALCRRLHGHSRPEDLLEALSLGTLMVAARPGRIAGYTTGMHFRGHTVTESNDEARALIAAAPSLPEPGFLVPASNGDLLRWAMDRRLRIVQPLTLMTRGVYTEPGGVFLPSIHA